MSAACTLLLHCLATAPLLQHEDATTQTDGIPCLHWTGHLFTLPDKYMTLNRRHLPTSCPHPSGRPTSSLNGMSRTRPTHNLMLTCPCSPVSMLFIASRCTRHPQPTSTHQNHNRSSSKPCTHACMAHAVPVEVGLFVGLQIDEYCRCGINTL